MNKHYDQADLKAIKDTNAFNEDVSVFLAQQLTHVRNQALEVKKAPLNAFQVFPVTTDIPKGADSAVQYIYDAVGIAKVIADYADDLPRVDVFATEQVVRVKDLGVSYGYSDKELANAAYARVNLSASKATKSRRAIDLKINQIAWKGDTANKITGFLNNPNISEYTLPKGASGQTTFVSKTEAEILKDITGFLQTIADATNEVEQANTLLLAPNAYAHLATTRLADSDRTLLEFVRQVNPNLTRIMKVGELKGASADGSDMMVAGYFDPDYIKLEIPERFDQKPAERRNLETVINCTASVAGVTVAIPMAFVKAKGC